MRHESGERSADRDCHAGAICVGPGKSYPIGRKVGVTVTSRFVVPELPKEHDSSRSTYYDYLNIFWTPQPRGGYMNQFVPQLMLGDALANSTNSPYYKPEWIKLDSWHIGAQYFMGLCVKNETYSDGFECDPQTWLGRAATGRLVPVEPGEVVETSFELIQQRRGNSKRFQRLWRLSIFVVGGGPDRRSVVIVDRPFMGLVEATKTWDEEIYENVYIGSCLENYGMESADDYPPGWQMNMEIWSPDSGTWWDAWRVDEKPTCPWQPKSTLESSARNHQQTVLWEAFMYHAEETGDGFTKEWQSQMWSRY